MGKRLFLLLPILLSAHQFAFCTERQAEFPGFFHRLVSKFELQDNDISLSPSERYFKFSINTVANSVPLLQLYRQILEEHNVPVDFSLLPLIESANNPFAQSHKNAVGLWQFIPATGAKHGLRITATVDDRKNVILSTAAAADHLSYLHSQLNNWVLVVAAYNCGLQCVINAQKKVGNNGLRQVISKTPLETRDYVLKFLAIREFVIANRSHPALSRFPDGIYLQRLQRSKALSRSSHALPGLDDVMRSRVSQFLNYGVDNPGGPVDTNSRIELIVLTPLFRDFFSEKEISFNTQNPKQTSSCIAYPRKLYTVKEGETLSKVALKLKVSVNALRDLNGGITSTRIGMVLRVC